MKKTFGLMALMALFLSSNSVFAYKTIEGICSSSLQKNPWIQVILNTAEAKDEKSYAVVNEYNYEGELVRTETIVGKEPDFTVIKAVTEEGEKIFILTYLKGNDPNIELYQYVCYYE